MSAHTPEQIAAMQAWMLGKGFGEMLGAKIETMEEDYCRMILPWREDLSRGDDRFHGGVIAALIDKAGTAAAWSYPDIPEGTLGATVGMNVNFLAAAWTDMVAEARTVRRGGSIVVIDIDVKGVENGEIFAKGMVTYKLSWPSGA